MAAKRLVIVRHGEGQHQLKDRNFARDLGPGLTQGGEAQAKAIACNPVFARAVANAERPLFVASNLLRAVETMAWAAPGRCIVVQPHARELIKGSNDFPSSLEGLERWAQRGAAGSLENSKKLSRQRRIAGIEQAIAAGVDLELEPYRDALHAMGEPNFTDYVRKLCTTDCTIMPATLSDNIETWDHISSSFEEAFRRGLATLSERVRQLMLWIAMQDADIVFLVAHGDFLNFGIERAAEGASAPAHSWGNCEVREFTLVPAAGNEWRLVRAGRSGCSEYKVPRGLTIQHEDSGVSGLGPTPAAAWAPIAEELRVLSPKDLPRVFVFDLDDTVWRGDLDRTGGPPFTLGEEKKLMSANGTFVTPFAHIPDIFSWIEENGCMAALASAGGQEDKWPGCGCTENALRLITTRSGRTLADIMRVRRIHFTKTKDVTLTEIAEECRCEPRDMVFFDNSKDRVQEALAVGITTCYCPEGLSWTAFVRCTSEYARRLRKGEKKAKYVKA